MMRKCVEETVRGGVVALTRLANQGTRRGEDYEKIQRSFSKQAMKNPSADHLRPQNLVHRSAIEL